MKIEKKTTNNFVEQDTNQSVNDIECGDGHGTTKFSYCPMLCFTTCRLSLFSEDNVRGGSTIVIGDMKYLSLVTEACPRQQLLTATFKYTDGIAAHVLLHIRLVTNIINILSKFDDIFGNVWFS